jgi:DNA-binding transcriptional LysR family regulator
MGYRLEWVTSFVAVADEGGFSAAALALRRSQPRVSAHVADLEKALDVLLFDRSCHPAVLTSEGCALLPHARTALAHFQELARAAADLREGRKGEVRLGIHREAAPFLVPRVMLRLRESRPGLRVRLRELTCRELDAALLAGDLDLAVRPVSGTPADAGLARRSLWHETLVAVLRRGTAGLPGVPLSPSALAGRPLVVVSDPDAAPDAPDDTRAVFGPGGDEDLTVFRTSQAQTLVSMVQHGWGVGLVRPVSLCTSDLDGVEVVPVGQERKAPYEPGAPGSHAVPRGMETALWWRADRPPSPARHAVEMCVRMSAVPVHGYIRERFLPLPATPELLPTGSWPAAPPWSA